jgi:hypothetical protein
MAKLPKEIADFMEKHGVTSDEIWLVAGGKNYAIKHKALERIAADNGIKFDRPSVIEANSAEKIAVVCVFGTMGDRTEWSFGEAAPYNYRTTEKMAAYPYAMAEKRAKDRVVLKLLNTHCTLYSEDEADDFKQPRENPHVNRPEDMSDAKPKIDPETGEFLDFPSVPGVAPRPKAGSRALFDELQKELMEIDSHIVLGTWIKSVKKEAATLPVDWREILNRKVQEQRMAIDELQAQEAAE